MRIYVPARSVFTYAIYVCNVITYDKNVQFALKFKYKFIVITRFPDKFLGIQWISIKRENEGLIFPLNLDKCFFLC